MADIANDCEEDKRESMPQNPSSKSRSKTDAVYLYFFAIFCVVTVIINIYASVTADDIEYVTQLMNTSTYSLIVQNLNNYNISFDVHLIFNNATAWAVAAAFYLILLLPTLGLLRWALKMLIYVAVIKLYIFIIVLPVLLIVLAFGTSDEVWKYSGYKSINSVIFGSILYLIILIPTVICVKTEGIKAIFDLIDRSCRTIICIRSVLSFISFILSYLLILIFEIILLFFMKSCLKPTLNGVLLCVSVFGSLYILLFCYYFGVAVVSRTAACRHKSQNDKIISRTALGESIRTVYRFHLGTIAYAASMILPIFSAIVAAFKHTIETDGNRTIPRIFKLVLIGRISDFALIQTAVHGHNFAEATKRSFNVMVKNYSISLVIIMVVESIIYIVIGIAVILSLLLMAGCGYSLQISSEPFYTILIIVALPIFLIVESAANTTLICTLEKREDDQNVQMNTLSCYSQNGNAV